MVKGHQASIVDRLFYLSLVSLVLGIVSFLYVERLRQKHEWTITGHVFLSNGKPIKGAIVFVEGIDRSKETDATGWFSIAVNDQESWTIHAIYKDQSVETKIEKKNANKPVRLIIPVEEPNSNLPPFTPSNVIELPKDPVPYLQVIKRHLDKKFNRRDSSEQIINFLKQICQNDPKMAKLIFRWLIYEQYLIPVSGNRYELSQKAIDTIIKGRS